MTDISSDVNAFMAIRIGAGPGQCRLPVELTPFCHKRARTSESRADSQNVNSLYPTPFPDPIGDTGGGRITTGTVTRGMAGGRHTGAWMKAKTAFRFPR